MLVCGRKDGTEKVGSNHRGGVSPLFLLVVACSDLQDLVLLLGLVKCLSVKLSAHCSLFFHSCSPLFVLPGDRVRSPLHRFFLSYTPTQRSQHKGLQGRVPPARQGAQVPGGHCLWLSGTSGRVCNCCQGCGPNLNCGHTERGLCFVTSYLGPACTCGICPVWGGGERHF